MSGDKIFIDTNIATARPSLRLRHLKTYSFKTNNLTP